jgi:tRNA 5-methylaminomethyl-2-thiouridine biosynthesis bifunctional protein
MPKIETSPSPVIWGEDGAPRSRLYDDVYYSSDDGLAEARAVFLDGCGLPRAWAGRNRFCVAELGFGTGLNVVALLEAWRTAGPPGAHLCVFSVEAHPLSSEEAARALAALVTVAAGLLLFRPSGKLARPVPASPAVMPPVPCTTPPCPRAVDPPAELPGNDR